MLTTIKNVPIKLKSWECDYKQIEDLSEGFINSGKTLKTSKAFDVEDFNISLLKPYLFTDKIDSAWYILDANGFLYCYDNGSFDMMSEEKFSKDIKLIKIPYRGDYAILAVSGINCKILINPYQSEDAVLPSSVTACLYKDRLFLGKNKIISFTKPFDFTSIDNGGEIKLPIDSSEILALAVLEEKLFALTENAIYKINVDGVPREWAINKVNKENLNVASKSCSVSENQIYFINENKFCKFDGSKISYIRSQLENSKINFISNANVVDDNYTAIVKIDGNLSNFVYFFNLKTGEEFMTMEKGTYLTGLGYSVDEDLTLNTLKENVMQEIRFVSKECDFDVKKPKFISKISVFLTSPISLRVKCDNTECTFNLSKGYNVIHCNFETIFIKFELSGQSEKNEISSLKVEYQIKGE